MSNMDHFYDTAFAPFVLHFSFAFHGRKTNTHVGTNIGESFFFWGGGGGLSLTNTIETIEHILFL